MNKSLREHDYLSHIEEAICRIQRYLEGKTEQDFLSDSLIQDAVIRNLEIIGEAVTKLGLDLKEQYKHVPWGEIAGMRNRLIHGYFAVNLRIVWDTVEKVLPGFLAKIHEIKDEQARTEGPSPC